MPRLVRLTRIDALSALLVFALALTARLPLIQRGETLLHPDEAIVGLMAQDIRAGDRFPIYFYGQRYMGALEAYVVAALETWTDDPLIALRLAPDLCFAALAALQTLMLTRWFGRRGGLIGASVLIFAPPMFAQWSVSARGGYIEILLWGSALLWCYGEWFARRSVATPRQRFVTGLLAGSGFWINPSILFFVAPIVLDTLLRRFAGRRTVLRYLRRVTLPILAVCAVVALNLVWSVRVEEAQVQTSVLLDLVPRALAAAILTVIAGMALFVLLRTIGPTHARDWLRRNTAMILGALIGAAPALAYVGWTLIRATPMEPSLPLGFRPIWHTGETLLYFLHGLPLLFGADPGPFLDHVTVGRAHALRAPHEAMELLTAAARIAGIAASCVLAVAFLRVHGRRMATWSALRARRFSPVMLLTLGTATTIGLYLLGSCSCSFTTIRYLVPLWVFLPGLVASVYVSPRAGISIRGAVVAMLCAWGVGQASLIQRIGAPHPLRPVAERLMETGTTAAVADILDAQLLSYLTCQKVRLAEYDPFWSRLGHYRADPAWQAAWRRQSAVVVQTREIDRTREWTDAGFPGPPPPETQRFCWPALKSALARVLTRVEQREPLGGGYELLRLVNPTVVLPGDSR